MMFSLLFGPDHHCRRWYNNDTQITIVIEQKYDSQHQCIENILFRSGYSCVSIPDASRPSMAQRAYILYKSPCPLIGKVWMGVRKILDFCRCLKKLCRLFIIIHSLQVYILSVYFYYWRSKFFIVLTINWAAIIIIIDRIIILSYHFFIVVIK